MAKRSLLSERPSYVFIIGSVKLFLLLSSIADAVYFFTISLYCTKYLSYFEKIQRCYHYHILYLFWGMSFHNSLHSQQSPQAQRSYCFCPAQDNKAKSPRNKMNSFSCFCEFSDLFSFEMCVKDNTFVGRLGKWAAVYSTAFRSSVIDYWRLFVLMQLSLLLRASAIYVNLFLLHLWFIFHLPCWTLS